MVPHRRSGSGLLQVIFEWHDPIRRDRSRVILERGSPAPVLVQLCSKPMPLSSRQFQKVSHLQAKAES